MKNNSNNNNNNNTNGTLRRSKKDPAHVSGGDGSTNDSTITNGNNNQNQNQNQNHLPRGRGGRIVRGEALYHPSIFRYSCHGNLRLDSQRLPNSAGVCHGIQSQLEHVDHWRLVTRQEAIDVFSQQALANAGGAGAAGAADASGPSVAGSSTTTASSSPSSSSSGSVVVQPTMIAPVLIYPPASANSNSNSNHIPSSTISLLPHQETWSCYGKNHVDLLVLRQQGTQQEEIVAVAPYSSPGMAIRNLQSTDGTETTTTLRLGVLEIMYQSHMDDDGLAEGDLDQYDDNITKGRNKRSNPHNTDDTRDPNDKTTKQNQSPWFSPLSSSSSSSNTSSTKPYPRRFLDASYKILHHMQLNAKILQESVQEEFPHRTWMASQRIVQEFPATYQRTVSLMKKVMAWDDDDNNDNDNDNNKQ